MPSARESRLLNEGATDRKSLAILAMLASPLFFSSNLIFGRVVAGEVAPFTLAFIRWSLVAAMLVPFVIRDKDLVREKLRSQVKSLAILGFLGMWICGALVYLALEYTTATNATLIYTTSPVFIILIEAAFAGRRIGMRETIGSALALTGIAVIVLRGDLTALLSLTFNRGDLLVLAAAVAWAFYSIRYRSPGLADLPNVTLFGLVAAAGAMLLLPFAAYDYLSDAAMPASAGAWTNIGGIVFFASLLAFSTFQFGVRTLGASLAGVFMYLLPAYGVLMARIFLGEPLHGYHLCGIALVMAGVILATMPAALLRRRL